MKPPGLAYQSPRLSPSGICTSIDKRAGAPSDTVAVPPAPASPSMAAVAAGSSLAVDLQRKARAAWEMVRIQNSLVGNDAERWGTLASSSERAADDFRQARAPAGFHEDDLEMALEHYVSGHGDFFLMQSILQGHATLQGFLASMSARSGSGIKVEEYVAEYLDYTGADEYYTVDDLHSRYESDLQSETQILREFLENAVTLTGINVVKGIKTATNSYHLMNTTVDIREYVRTFLAGDWIHHRGFLSTSASWKQATNFSDCEEKPEPLFSVRIDDMRPNGVALKRTLGAKLDAAELDGHSLMHVFRCERAKGAIPEAVLGRYALNMEREILLAPGHVSTPEQIILCDTAIVLVSTVTHASSLDGDAARAWFYTSEWHRQKETLQDDLPAWSAGEGSGEAFLAHLTDLCMASPAVRDYGEGDNAGLLTEHRLALNPGHPPITVLCLKHPIYPRTSFIRKLPEGADELARARAVAEVIDAAKSAMRMNR